MKTTTFQSSLAKKMDDFVIFKQLQGYDYTIQALALGYFDTFTQKRGCKCEYLTKQAIEDYIDQTARLKPNSQRARLSVLRGFSEYLHRYDHSSYVLPSLSISSPSLPRWYQYSNEEITSLLRDAKTLTPSQSLRPHCFHMLIGLLYVSGLRISEALALKLKHIDIDNNTVFVRKGKFGKDRYLVLEESTVQIIGNYLEKRLKHPPTEKDTPFFVTRLGKPLEYENVARTYRRMIRKCRIGIHSPQLPRLHDLRHSFACNCLIKWYDEGVDINARLPVLATAMGHINIQSTQIYLHVTSTLLQKAAKRFHHTFTANCKGE